MLSPLIPSWFLLTHTKLQLLAGQFLLASPTSCVTVNHRATGCYNEEEHYNCLARSLNFTHRTN